MAVLLIFSPCVCQKMIVLLLAKGIGANKSQLMSNLVENAIAADLLSTVCTKTRLTFFV